MTLLTRDQFEWLLGHEVLVAARHRHFVSIVMVAGCEGVEVAQLLRETLRTCDGCLDHNGTSSVLMLHTSTDQARQAIGRFKQRCSNLIDFRFGVACYPQDAGVAADLLDLCETRLLRAKRRGFGAVVFKEDAGAAQRTAQSEAHNGT